MPLSEVHKTLQGYTAEERQKILDSISTLAVTAQFMGGDFRMKVLLNKPGAGWSWNFKHNEVLVDPETILKSPPYVSKATYCHEGFHRRITPGSIIPESNLQKLGYLFLVNCIEDCRIENFGADAYPSYRPVRDKAYAYNTKQLDEAWQKAVVKPPYHTAAGLELIRQWFREERGRSQKISPTTPSVAANFVTDVLPDCKDAWWTFPDLNEVASQPWKIEKYFESCLDTINTKIWPKFDKLVQQDRLDELHNEAVRSLRERHRASTAKPGDPPLTPSPDATTRLLEDREVTDLIDFAQKGKVPHATAEDLTGRPVDVRELSSDTRKKIKEYLDTLSQSERDKLQEQADLTLLGKNKQVLEVVEGRSSGDSDPLTIDEGFIEGLFKWLRRKLLEPSNNDEQLDSHVGVEGSGNGQGGDLGGTAGGGGVLDETTRREIEQDFSKLVFTSQGRYYDILRQYADTINALENGLRRIFEERRLAGLESGLRSGPRLNVRRYVNDRAAGRHPVESRPFERKILPSEKDYAVTVLVDQSGSMGGEPIRRAFEAAVCVTEVLSRLNIEHSISGYDHSSRDYKEFSQDLDFKRLERIEWEGGGGTNEAYALRAALAMLENRKEEKKVLIVIGDGGVMPDVGIVTRSVEQKGQVRLVGLGIGPGTLNMTNYYKNCRAGMAVEELPVALTDAVREAIEDVK